MPRPSCGSYLRSLVILSKGCRLLARRSCGARRERRLHRARRPKGTENFDSRDRRGGELGRNVIGDAGQPENAKLHGATGVSELLEIVAAVLFDAEDQVAAGDGPVDRVRPAFELPSDRRTYEICAVCEKALAHEQVDLTQVDQAHVDRDLLAPVDFDQFHHRAHYTI